MNTRKRPCEQCPWRRDIEPGQFPADRYDELRDTTGEPGAEASFDAAIFACHKSSEGEPMPCAGWLAAVGFESLRVRLLLSSGAIPPEAMHPGDDWPPLFDNYAEMAATQGGQRGATSVCLNKRCDAHGQVQTVTPGHPCPVCASAQTSPSTSRELEIGANGRNE